MSARIAAALLAAFTAGPLSAQGLSVHSHGACALGRNSAGVADPCADGSAVFYNPAAVASRRAAASAGVSALYSTSTFTFDGTGEAFDSRQGTTLAPHLWLAGPVATRVGAGIGVWAPYGLATAWPLDFEGRFDGYDNELRALYVQPTLAAELIPGRMSLGAGVAAVVTSVRIRRRLDLARVLVPGTGIPFGAIGVPGGTDFGDAELEVDDVSATFHVGVRIQPADWWAVGVRYLHSADLDLTGGASIDQIVTGIRLPAGNPFGLPAGTPLDPLLAPRFEPRGPLADQALATELTLPNQLVAGVRFLVTPATRLFIDYQWTGWSRFDGAVLRFENAPADTLFLDYDDASTLRFAVDVSPPGDFTYRGGVLLNTAAAPAVTVNPLLPESRRASFAGGVGYRIGERLDADLGLELLLQEDRDGRVRPRTSRSQTARDLNVGRYSAYGVFGGITVTYRLGPAGS